MIAEGADIIDIGAESTRPYGARTGLGRRGAETPAADPGRRRFARHSRIHRQHEIGRRRLGARRRCLHRQRRLGPAARSRHGRAVGGAPFAGHRHAQPRQRRCRHRHHAGYRSVLRALARDRRQGRHFTWKYRARPRHRLWQDAGAEHDGAGPAGRTRAISACRSWSARRASASSARWSPSEPHQRLGGSIAAHLVAAKGGARIIRTHDVAETVQALRVAAAIWDKR